MIDIKTFVVFGLRRTGNHAIINWICRQNIPAAHFNNCVRGPVGDIQKSHTNKFYFKDKIVNESRKRLKDFNLALFNFENQPVEDVTFGLKFLRLNMKKVKYIVIVRDPFNLFASRLNSSNGGNRYVDVWKNHVLACMNGSNVVAVNFNEWFSSKEYRKNLAEELELDFTDEGVEQVFWFGASSFDGKTFDGKAQDMKVLERWKSMANSPNKEKYNKIVSDPEVRRLSKEFFNFPIGGEKCLT